jgi:DHA2 family multidrug resistance protein
MVLQFVVGFILTSTTVLIPEFVQQLLGYNATDAGLVLMPGGIALMVMMPFAGRLVGKVQPKYLMAIGLALTAASMFVLTGIDTTVDFRHLAWVRALQCIGLPLFFVPLNTIAYGNLPRGKNNQASAMMNLMRNLGGGVGISIATTLLYRREQLHQNRLASAANLARPAFVERLHAHGGSGPGVLVGFYRELQQQAAMLSFLDLFQIFGFGCLVVIAMVLCLKRVRRGQAPVATH